MNEERDDEGDILLAYSIQMVQEGLRYEKESSEKVAAALAGLDLLECQDELPDVGPCSVLYHVFGQLKTHEHSQYQRGQGLMGGEGFMHVLT